eukprot:gene42115-51424_t
MYEDDLNMSKTFGEDELIVLSSSQAKRSLERPQSASSKSSERRVAFGSSNQASKDQPKDLEYYQEKNREQISSLCPYLHPNTVLLVGSVLSANLRANEQSGDKEDTVFFKVLYVEASSQPMMFRCKTPVFTSPPVQGTSGGARGRERYEWSEAEGSFHFDVLVPASSSPSAMAAGDLLVSVYRGKGVLLGQAVFGVAQLARGGQVEHVSATEEVQARSLAGAFPVALSADASPSGDITLQMCVAWREEPAAEGPAAANPSTPGIGTGTREAPPRPPPTAPRPISSPLTFRPSSSRPPARSQFSRSSASLPASASRSPTRFRPCGS